MHHDEFPLSGNFISKVLNLINMNINSDVFLMDLLIKSNQKNHLNHYLPIFIRIFLIKYIYGYVLRRNFLGPVSSLIVRRSVSPYFDEKLRWAVDSDFYFRLRKNTKHWISCKSLKIASISGRDDSITSKISSNLNEIRKFEFEYMRKKYPSYIFWLNLCKRSFLHYIEILLWVLLRSTSIVFDCFSRFRGCDDYR
jgi:hypothetical protein